MVEATFQQELNDDLFYADVRKKYSSRGVAQAKKIKEQTTALFAGGELSEKDQAAFVKEMADAVIRRYKTRDSEEIISRRAIKLKDIRYCHDLLGYYTVILNCEYIGINSNCTNAQRVSAIAHELRHALFDRKHASSGQTFQDTYFYSLDNQRQNGEPTLLLPNCCWQTMLFWSRLATMNTPPTRNSWRQICLPAAPLLTAP